MNKVVQKGNYIYLNVSGRWLKYDFTQKPVGSGAMGTVYVGYDCKTNEKVAIKKVLDRYSNVQAIRQRAKLEASLMFRHRNLVEMLGYCEMAENHGPIYIISKFVHGDNIDKFVNKELRRRPDATQRICQMFFPILDALDYIHSKNILHLDIKPSNIMVENGRNIRLMDLGIAQYNDNGGSTGSGMMGTPKYAAPEQLVGGVAAMPSRQSDIYEAGVTLYELLTGENPYTGVNLAEIKDKHNNTELPSHKNLTPALLEVLRQATKPVISERYRTAKEFKMALQHALTVKEPESNLKWWIVGIATAVLTLSIVIFLVYG